jgi:DNA-binding response OmpR family regulator
MADADATTTVLIYSHDSHTRERTRLALGRRLAPDLPQVEYLMCATAPAVVRALDRHAAGKAPIDLLVLDGEAAPAGGMGLCRQLKDEISDCPPVILLIARPQDVWLATWSRAEEIVTRQGDPVSLAQAAVALVRSRSAVPQPRSLVR